MDASSSAKLTPEIIRKIHQPPIRIPPEDSVPPEIAQVIEERWHCATMSINRRDALESLWAAIKDKETWRVGYNPAFTTACENLRKLEADQ